MNLSQDFNKMTSKVDKWSDKHHPYVLEYLRIIFGIVVVIKAFSFSLQKDLINGMVANSNWDYLTRILIQSVNSMHIILGLLVAIGLFTRISSLLLIPVLIANIAFYSTLSGFLPIYGQISLYLMLVIMAIFYSVYGAGHYSLDHFRKPKKAKKNSNPE